MKNKDLFLIIILVLIDRISKVLVTKFIKYMEVIYLIKNKIYSTYVTNTGMAFSMFENKTWLLIIVSIVLLYFLIKYYKTIDDKTEKITMTLIISGLIGNLIDRIFLGHVIDFIGIGSFPIFNIADSYIVIGVIILISFVIGSDLCDKFNSRRGKKRKTR